MVVVSFARAAVAGLVLWAWRTSKNAALPVGGCVLVAVSVVYGAVKWAYLIQTPGSDVMHSPVSAYMVPLSFLLTGKRVSPSHAQIVSFLRFFFVCACDMP